MPPVSPRGPWRFVDRFGDGWSASVPEAAERGSAPAPSAGAARRLVAQLVFQAFSDDHALDDGIAGALLAAYDRLTNQRLSEALPRPTRDPRGLLRGRARELRDALVFALVDDRLRIERVERAPWPFRDREDPPPASEEPAPASDKTTWIGLCLVDQNGAPVGNRRYVLTLPDGSTTEGTLDSEGTARVEGIPEDGTCKIDFLDFDKVDWSPATLLPGSTIPGMTGPVEPPGLEEVQISLVDDSGAPMAGVKYCVTAADGRTFEGTLDQNGTALVTGMAPGQCTVSFPDFDGGDFAAA